MNYIAKPLTEEGKIVQYMLGIDTRILEWNVKLNKAIDISEIEKIKNIINSYQRKKSRLQRELENGK